MSVAEVSRIHCCDRVPVNSELGVQIGWFRDRRIGQQLVNIRVIEKLVFQPAVLAPS